MSSQNEQDLLTFFLKNLFRFLPLLTEECENLLHIHTLLCTFLVSVLLLDLISKFKFPDKMGPKDLFFQLNQTPGSVAI